MARYKPIDTSPRFIAVDLQRQLLPSTFEHALNHLIDNELDLSGFDARDQNDLTGASAYVAMPLDDQWSGSALPGLCHTQCTVQPQGWISGDMNWHPGRDGCIPGLGIEGWQKWALRQQGQQPGGDATGEKNATTGEASQRHITGKSAIGGEKQFQRTVCCVIGSGQRSLGNFLRWQSFTCHALVNGSHARSRDDMFPDDPAMARMQELP